MTDFALSSEAHDYIRQNFLPGATLVELGSGEGSAELAKDYILHSIEDDARWVNKFPKVNYIHAPLRQHKALKGFDTDVWYDPKYLRNLKEIPAELYIIDGPKAGHGYGTPGRSGALKYFDLFREGVPFLIDDVHRKMEYKLAVKISARLKTPMTIYGTWTYKHFAVIWPGKI